MVIYWGERSASGIGFLQKNLLEAPPGRWDPLDSALQKNSEFGRMKKHRLSEPTAFLGDASL